MVDDVDICAVFDQIVLAQDSFKKEGFGVGLEQGRLSGYYDGYKTGAVQGAKLASEMGFYDGMAIAWKQFLEREPDKNKRKLKALSSLIDAVHSVSRYDPSDPHVNEHAEMARMKFKQVSSLLNLKSTFHKGKQSLTF
ncbi:hypothetical protein LSH36_72g04057 [Paralvinella palmiformis]|uniref:Essential protein Yae1 N-terminal domain-containing protein n=1 Tax=Paralvinella palmiformis TaxID=53620 RepID=A0AAD9NB92_9ANNE|nr:hypothetical protein LSH36_72g04057 [Paralvinella palmiformis]